VFRCRTRIGLRHRHLWLHWIMSFSHIIIFVGVLVCVLCPVSMPNIRELTNNGDPSYEKEYLEVDQWRNCQKDQVFEVFEAFQSQMELVLWYYYPATACSETPNKKNLTKSSYHILFLTIAWLEVLTQFEGLVRNLCLMRVYLIYSGLEFHWQKWNKN